jgi:S1-C subfamily serine protease
VTLGDQSVYEAAVVGYDEDKDVAVLHIDAPKEKLRPIPIGVSADLLVGQKVYAIGNPVGKLFAMTPCFEMQSLTINLIDFTRVSINHRIRFLNSNL